MTEKLSGFFKIFITLLIGILLRRIIQLTDTCMLAHLNQQGLAISTILKNMLFIDFVVALSFSPILAAQLTDALKRKRFKTKLNLTLSLILFLSLLSAVLTLFLSPFFLDNLSNNPSIHTMAKQATILVVIGIIPEFFRYCLNMILQIKGRIRISIAWMLGETVLNFILNYYLAYMTPLGIYGIFFSTIISSTFVSIMLFSNLWRFVNLEYIIKLLISTNRTFRKSVPMLLNVFKESTRITLNKGLFLIIFFIISENSENLSYFAVFGAFQTIYSLIQVPLIALMRSLILKAADIDQSEEIQLQKILCFGFAITTTISILLYLFNNQISSHLFNMNSSINICWFKSLTITLIFWMPAEYIHSIQRARFYTTQAIGTLLKIDTFTSWSIVPPFFYIGLHTNNPYLAWSGFGICAWMAVGITCIFYSDGFIKVKRIIKLTLS